MCQKSFGGETFQPERLESDSSGHRVEIEVLPRLGANLRSFKVDGRELIYFSRKRLLEDGFHTGCFMMFPTPCRLTGARYTFQGRRIEQTKHGEPVSIHGLIRDETFAVSRFGDRLACTMQIDSGHPAFEGYPFPCTFALEFRLLERGLQIKFDYKNTGTGDAPFGLGLHPFWRIPGSRNDVSIQVPCRKALELVDLIPTGQVTPVDGTTLDLRSFRNLSELDIDNAFWDRDMTSDQAIRYTDLGIQLTLQSSEIFEHMIAYTTPAEPFVCLENLTCCPDAPNVYAKGFKDVSGLKIVPPGQSLEGWVRYTLTDL